MYFRIFIENIHRNKFSMHINAYFKNIAYLIEKFIVLFLFLFLRLYSIYFHCQINLFILFYQ